jgi:hypothetical protein
MYDSGCAMLLKHVQLVLLGGNEKHLHEQRVVRILSAHTPPLSSNGPMLAWTSIFINGVCGFARLGTRKH